MHDRNQDVIALTHVCRTWREIFTSRSSLWANFDCEDADKTRVYLERSKTSPINLLLGGNPEMPPRDLFFQVIPHATTRLKCLIIRGTSEKLRDIAKELSHPAPLLETLTIEVECGCSLHCNAPLTPALFNGGLSSLRTLHLYSVYTELPWRNMVSLTSFMLGFTSPGNVSLGHLLDFLEGAPHLRNVQLYSATSTSDAQNGRLVSLACLKRMVILGNEPSSPLLDHLLIPVGAKLTTRVGADLFDSTLEGSVLNGHLPKSLDNLRNLSDFTKICLRVSVPYARIRFSGPNGRVNTVPMTPQIAPTRRVFESLARFDTSKTERLKIIGGSLLDSCSVHRALLRMKDLRVLTISRSKNIFALIDTLCDHVVCPNLEEVVLEPREGGEKFDIQKVIGMAAKRASRGAKLKSLRIVGGDRSVQIRASGLEEHVSHVEFSPGVAAVSDDSDDSDVSDNSDDSDFTESDSSDEED